MGTDEQTLQAWSDYINEYEQKLQDAKQQSDSTMQDSTASNADRFGAASDYLAQEQYLQQLQTEYQRLQDMHDGGQPLPDTVNFHVAGVGAMCQNNVGLLSSVSQDSFLSGNDVSVFHTDFCNVYLKSTTTVIPDSVDSYSGTQGNIYAAGGIADFTGSPFYSYDIRDTMGYCSTVSGQSIYGGYGVRVGTNIRIVSDVSTINFPSDIPTIATGDPSAYLQIATANQSIYYGLSVIGIGKQYNFGNTDVSTESPWDYFNDNILPDLHDNQNAVFPNGYNPDPEKPEPEMPEIAGEQENGGHDVTMNDPSGIGGGFGFMTQYALRAADINDLGAKLWAGFDRTKPNVDDYINNFEYRVNLSTGSVNFVDIMEFFVSLRVYPFALGNVSGISPAGNNFYIGAGTEPIVMNNIIHTMDSYVGVLDCGDLELPFWFGDYREYSLNITLYLPYCGSAQLNAADIMGGKLHCFYLIDFCTGACTGYCTCTTWDGVTFPVAAIPGQVGADVPMSGNNANRVAARMFGDRITFIENMVGVAKSGVNAVTSTIGGNPFAGLSGMFSEMLNSGFKNLRQDAEKMERGAIGCPVLGSAGGFSGFSDSISAYVQIRTPIYPDVSQYSDTVGLPSSEHVTIGSCSGWCQFVNVDVSGINADNNAQQTIKSLLQSGIYI